MFGCRLPDELFRRLVYSPDLMRACRVVALRQCNSYGSMNVRRFIQLLELYKRLYNEQSAYCLFLKHISVRFPLLEKSYRTLCRLAPQGGALLSASLFSFSAHGITDEDMIHVANAFVQESKNDTAEANENHDNKEIKFNERNEPSSRSSEAKADSGGHFAYNNGIINAEDLQGWEFVSKKNDFYVWRRRRAGLAPKDGEHSSDAISDSRLYEYKCAGHFMDVPAYGFFIAQIDLEYRKKWDHLVLCLDVVESDVETYSEVIRWVTHFPYPMCPREYVYVRRACLDSASNSIILTSKTVNHDKCPRDDENFVRVDDYYSCMVIKSHGDDFTQNGFDYVLTYFDDPKAPFPSLAYNWMVSTGVPNFVQKVYKAAKALKTVSDCPAPHEDAYEHSSSGKVCNESASEYNNGALKYVKSGTKIYALPTLRRSAGHNIISSNGDDGDNNGVKKEQTNDAANESSSLPSTRCPLTRKPLSLSQNDVASLLYG